MPKSKEKFKPGRPATPMLGPTALSAAQRGSTAATSEFSRVGPRRTSTLIRPRCCNGSTSSQISIGPGASLAVYVGGASAVSTQVNNQGRAKDFSYYGLPSNTSVTFGGNAALIGTIYCPNADFTLGGGGNDVYDFEGSVMAKTI